MRIRRLYLFIATSLGVICCSAAVYVAFGPPNQYEINLWTSRLQRAVESRSWSGVEALLDPQTCPVNPLYQQTLQNTLNQFPESQIRILSLRADRMWHVDCPCVQGWAELNYVDPVTGRVLAREEFFFYGVKRAGRLWLDCGSG